MRKIDLDRTGGRAFADHDVEFEVFEGRIKNFLYNRGETMDFVNEENVMRLQAREHCSQVTCLFKDRAGGLTKFDAEFVGDDVCQSCFT